MKYDERLLLTLGIDFAKTVLHSVRQDFHRISTGKWPLK
jgi:hypothetical protein